MKTTFSFRSLIMAGSLFSVLAIIGCSKTEMQDGPGVEASAGSLRGRALVNRLVAVSPRYGQTTYNFAVSSACDCVFGTITCTGTTAPLGSALSSQNAASVTCQGTSPYGTPPNATACVLVKGENASTPGPLYYVKPASPGKVLSVRVKGATIPTNPDHTWFTYNETTDTWTADESASTYFTWSVLSTPPTYCCSGN